MGVRMRYIMRSYLSHLLCPACLRLTLTLHTFIHSSITSKRQGWLSKLEAICFLSVAFTCHVWQSFISLVLLRHHSGKGVNTIILHSRCVHLFFQNGSLTIHKVDWLTFCICMKNSGSIIHLSESKCLIVCVLASFHWTQSKCKLKTKATPLFGDAGSYAVSLDTRG